MDQFSRTHLFIHFRDFHGKVKWSPLVLLDTTSHAETNDVQWEPVPWKTCRGCAFGLHQPRCQSRIVNPWLVYLGRFNWSTAIRNIIYYLILRHTISYWTSTINQAFVNLGSRGSLLFPQKNCRKWYVLLGGSWAGPAATHLVSTRPRMRWCRQDKIAARCRGWTLQGTIPHTAGKNL